MAFKLLMSSMAKVNPCSKANPLVNPAVTQTVASVFAQVHKAGEMQFSEIITFHFLIWTYPERQSCKPDLNFSA